MAIRRIRGTDFFFFVRVEHAYWFIFCLLLWPVRAFRRFASLLPVIQKSRNLMKVVGSFAASLQPGYEIEHGIRDFCIDRKHEHLRNIRNYKEAIGFVT